MKTSCYQSSPVRSMHEKYLCRNLRPIYCPLKYLFNFVQVSNLKQLISNARRNNGSVGREESTSHSKSFPKKGFCTNCNTFIPRDKNTYLFQEIVRKEDSKILEKSLNFKRTERNKWNWCLFSGWVVKIQFWKMSIQLSLFPYLNSVCLANLP